MTNNPNAASSARALVAVPSLCSLLVGCIGARVIYPVMPSGAELRAFEAAGPADLQFDQLELSAMLVSGPYRIGFGDLLSVELPPEVELEQSDAEGNTAVVTIKSRVRAESGTVLLPMVGEQHVAGKTTGEVEELLAAAYHGPAKLEARPNVVVTVAEFDTVDVAVTGAVNQPGTHALRSDRRTVLGALTEAGGIKGERGAREVRVLSKEEGVVVARVLQVGLQDMLLGDLALRGGETVVVVPAAERAFSVIGLVKKSGVFDYPAPRRYNLLQALATAGGVDESAAPRYATVYRRNPDGSVLAATFQIDGDALENGSNITIKDGDVVAVEHTQGSWLRQFFSQVFGFRASVNLSSSASPTL